MPAKAPYLHVFKDSDSFLATQACTLDPSAQPQRETPSAQPTHAQRVRAASLAATASGAHRAPGTHRMSQTAG